MMNQKFWVWLLCCCFAHAQAQTLQGTSATNAPILDSTVKIVPSTETDDQTLFQQIRFYKIARQVLTVASPACTDRVSSNIPPGWVIDLKTDERVPKVLAVVPGTEAEKAGVLPGDVIKSIAGEGWTFVFGFNDAFRVSKVWSAAKTSIVPVTIERNGAPVALMLEARKGCMLGINFVKPRPLAEVTALTGLSGSPVFFALQLVDLSDGQIAAAVLRAPLEQAYRASGSVFETKEGTARIALDGLLLLAALAGRSSAGLNSANAQSAAASGTPVALELTGQRHVTAAIAAVLLREGFDPQAILPRLSVKDKEMLSSDKGKNSTIGIAQSAAESVLSAIAANPQGRWYAKFATRLPVKQLLLGDAPEPPLGPLDAPKMMDQAFKNCTAATAPVFPYNFTASGWAEVNDTARLPVQNPDLLMAYDKFLNLPYPRAFAIDSSGRWGVSSRANDTPERALASCVQAANSACYLYAFNAMVLFSENSSQSTCWGIQAAGSTTAR